MKRYSKQLIQQVEKLGFDHIWTNSQGHPCYAHPDDPDQTELSISPSIGREHVSKMLLRRAQKIAGTPPVITKRKGVAVKHRQTVERERAQQRLDWVQAARERLMAGKAEADHLAQLDQLVERRRRELVDLHQLMADLPCGVEHRGRGRVRHLGVARDKTPL